MPIGICKQCKVSFKVYPSKKRTYCSVNCFLSDSNSNKHNNSGLFRKGHSVWSKGMKLPKEIGEKISLSKTGFKYSEESKKKMSLAKIGYVPWIKGKKHTEETRAKMRKTRLNQVIPYRDSSIEVKLQNLLKDNGIEFSTHYPILGQPDIFIKPNIVIFADGCYWHGCKECGHLPGEKNIRDVKVTRELQSQGYVVIRLWEHEINQNLDNCFNKININ